MQKCERQDVGGRGGVDEAAMTTLSLQQYGQTGLSLRNRCLQRTSVRYEGLFANRTWTHKLFSGLNHIIN